MENNVQKRNARLIEPGLEDYGASVEGKIFNAEKKEYVQIEKSPKGFACVSINGKWYSASKLIWEAFNGKLPEGLKICCINHDRMNVRLDNLETFKPKREVDANDILSVIEEIRDLLQEHFRQAAQGKEFGQL